MKKSRSIISFCFVFFMTTGIAHAGALIYRIQQKQAQKQQQAQGMAEGQSQEGSQENQSQGQGAAPAQPTYQQTVDQRNQAIAQAILSAHSSSVSSENVPFGNNPDLAQSPPETAAPAPAEQATAPASSSTVQDEVDLSEVWKKLDNKSTVWPLLMDEQAKILTVSEYIDRFHKEGVKINEEPLHYVQIIDQIVTQNPQLLQRPFGELIQMVAIVDYDFDNGMDKDLLAKKVLGEAGYEANKKRFTQQQ